MQNFDWLVWLKTNCNVIGFSKAYKATNYTIKVGDGCIHWDFILHIDDYNSEGSYKFNVSIVGRNNPSDKFINEFKEKIKKDFRIINTDRNNIFFVTL